MNFYTPHHKCTVKYKDLGHAVGCALNLLGVVKNGILFFGKTDLKSAFRLLPLRPGVFWLLVMSACHPETGKKVFFVDKCMPFGHCISCALFQHFSDALAFLFKFQLRTSIQGEALRTALTNYLDDFLFAALSLMLVNHMLNIFL